MQTLVTGLTIGFVLFIFPLSGARAAQKEFWLRNANRAAFRSIDMMRKEQSIETRNVQVPVSRLSGVRELRARLGVVSGLSESAPAERRDVLEVNYKADGRVAGLWLFSRGPGLGRRAASLEEAVRQFVLDNKALYDLKGSDVAVPSDLDWLGKPDVLEGEYRGKRTARVVFHPTYRGFPIVDGEFSAIFVDDVLVALQGVLVNPAEDLIDTTIRLTGIQAANVAQIDSGGSAGATFKVTAGSPEANLSAARLLIPVEVEPLLVDSADGAVGLPKRVMVDASTGEVVSRRGMAAMAAGNYRVIKPYPTDANPVQNASANNQTWAATVDVPNDGFVYMWQRAAGLTDIITFSGLASQNGQIFTWRNPQGQNDFLATSGTRLAQQHHTFWLQTIRNRTDQYFSWLPASGSRNQLDVNAISEFSFTAGDPQSTNSSFFLPTGCRRGTAPDEFDGNACIHFNANSPSNYTGTKAEHVDSVFHEYGHFIDFKYRSPHRSQNTIVEPCNGGTSEEGASLGEAFAGMYALANMNLEFFPSPYLGFEGVSGSLRELSGHSAFAHKDSNSMKCYKTSNSCTATTQDYYFYGNATVQAFWESTVGRNCFSLPCYSTSVPPGSSHGAALNAIQYAIANTPTSGTHVDAVANLLGYYYWYESYDSWNDRWWIFNHHNLVGPAYGYSTCHM